MLSTILCKKSSQVRLISIHGNANDDDDDDAWTISEAKSRSINEDRGLTWSEDEVHKTLS